MKAYILKCKPNTQFHFGETALDEATSLNKTSEIIHSDTLFSSLVSVYAEVFGNPEKFIEKLGKQKISTAFHCLEHERKFVFFLPKPIHFNLNFSDFTNFKPFKKIKYISAGVWQKGLGADELLGKECIIIDGRYVCLQSEVQDWNVQDLKIIKENTLPKVHVHKPNTEDSIYYQTNIQIVDNTKRNIQTHFYFLSENELDNEVKVCFDILIDMGIGGERSTGCGRFESLEVSEQFPAMNFQDVKSYGLVSLFVPKTEQEVKDIAYYQPIFRGGRRIGKANTNIDKEKYLKQVRMVSEGAVLTNKTEGNVLNISSVEDDVYLRSGLAFLLPLHPKLNIMQNDKPKVAHIYPLKIKTLSPVSISTGEIFSDTIDFFVDKSNITEPKVYYLDQNKFEKLLESKNLVDAFTEIAINGDFRIFDFVRNRLRVSYEQVSTSAPLSLKCEIFENRKQGNRKEARFSATNIYPIIKNAGKPYIAGSSLKGAINTALLYDWLVNNSVGKKELNDFIVFLNTEFQALDGNIKQLFQDRKEYFEIAWEAKKEKLKAVSPPKDDPEYYRQKKIQHSNRDRWQRANEQLVSLLEPVIEKIDSKFDKIIEKLFGKTSDENNRMDSSLYQISDSQCFDKSEIVIYDTKRFHLEDGKPTISQVRETIEENCEQDITLVIDTIKNQANNPYLKMVLEGENPITQLFAKINSFSVANVNYELSEIENKGKERPKYRKFLESQKSKLQNPKSSAFLRVGSGKTYF